MHLSITWDWAWGQCQHVGKLPHRSMCVEVYACMCNGLTKCGPIGRMHVHLHWLEFGIWFCGVSCLAFGAFELGQLVGIRLSMCIVARGKGGQVLFEQAFAQRVAQYQSITTQQERFLSELNNGTLIHVVFRSI